MRYWMLAVLIWPVLSARVTASEAVVFNVRAHGAAGDGQTLDTDAINRAIDAAASAGGGTVHFPAGRYLSFSIHLKSHITLHLDSGAVIVAADPADGRGQYDLPEANEWDPYQDFGHSHWQNSLIWGIGLEDVAIVGHGLIDGRGLVRHGPGPRRPAQAGDAPTTLGSDDNASKALAAEHPPAGPAATSTPPPGQPRRGPLDMNGQGNKSIALKLCRNVTLRDFRILSGGHFALLATGVDNLTIDNLLIDTNRDGLDLDGCRNVRLSNLAINSPNDDAIVLKSSFALGALRPTENVTITNCHVSGYDLGTLFDGTFGRTQQLAPDRDGVTGRIKIGTESNGDFRNITISNCTFDRCRGLALETVDGGTIENVTAKNLVMREIVTAPLFIRLGNRGRGPGTPTPGAVRHVSISNVQVVDADPRYASSIAGLPGHDIQDVNLSDIHILYRGGGTREDAAREPAEMEQSYPEPSMFGTLPAYGLFARHVKGLRVHNVDFAFTAPDARPPVVLSDAQDVALDRVKAARGADVPFLRARRVTDLTLRACPGVRDAQGVAAPDSSF